MMHSTASGDDEVVQGSSRFGGAGGRNAGTVGDDR